MICARCGHENREGAKFCEECAAPLGDAAPAREQRKTVTVLFCDVTGSTSLGESTDPEALRALLARYFERMKGIVESHGGTVEKFIGDAVMAVFGVPQVHEDDALRAIRAAVEMREALPELGVQARIGVNTGEVVTGTEERLATGDPVNVAARLEQAAQPGEILVGEETLRLVRDAVEAETVEPLQLKGKAEPVPAHRLLALQEAGERREDTPFVGRARELALVREAAERARAERRCELFTILGDAGIGKSRLVAEALSALDARVVRGRCLPYGEGITYWPVVEVLKQLDLLPPDEAAAQAIRSLLGQTEAGTSAEEIAWAFRKTLERAAQERPLVCVFDDIHWGEQTFLDLVEHVALLSSGAPLLLLCMARPELGERRSGWEVNVRLEPLEDEEVDQLLPERLATDVREKVARAAGGNPLFVTELLAMTGESDGDGVVPPTLQALLAARLDQLDPGERSALERAAVEGEIFHRGVVQALTPDEAQVTPRLASLARKRLIRPDKAQLLGEDGFRFRHLLIRDAAYASLPKATRADLHERLAAWLQERAPDLVERDELLGYHLEQAARYKQELGQPDPKLAERAGERLAAAGQRALWRFDIRAAVPLLERALALLRPLRLDVHLELDLAFALNDPERAVEIAETAAKRAQAAGDEAGEILARLLAAHHRMDIASDMEVEHVEALAQQALGRLEQVGDHAGLARVWGVFTNLANVRLHHEEMAEAAEKSVRELRLAGQPSPSLGDLGWALVAGPRPANEALRTLESAMPPSPTPLEMMNRAWLLAMLRRFDEAWALAREASERWRELTGVIGGEHLLAELATLAGDHEAAATYLRTFCDYLEARGWRAFLSTYAPVLGRSLCSLGRYDEAEPMAQLGRELGDEPDLATQMLWRQAQARVHASRGEHADAERLACEAVALSEKTDSLNWQGNALCDLAEVLAAAGHTDEAAEALEQALERYERKKNLAMVGQVRPRLEALREEART